MSGIPFDDSLSETSSVADEERVRKLFQACDYNGDGFIDSSDLEMVCQELDLGQCVQELLSELGADRAGRVSYQDFQSRRRALRCEIAALKEADAAHSGGGSSQDLPATASNSGHSFNKQELWEWDSGARDLSPEPPTPPASAPPDAMAELASTLHLAAVSSLKNEVLELSARLNAAQRDRDSARDALCAAQTECGRLRCALTSQARAAEERLTELHGVIAELRRAGAARQRQAIPELREDDSEIETSCRENSITGGAGSDRTTSLGEADETASIQNDPVEVHSPVSPAALPAPDFPPAPPMEVSDTEPTPLATPDRRIECMADSTSFEDETLEIDRRKYSNDRCRRRSPRCRDTPGSAGDGEEDDDTPVHYSPRLHARPSQHGSSRGGGPQTKMASRVRLRRTHEDGRLTGKDICQEGVFSSAVAEHLARGTMCGRGEEGERLGAKLDRLEADNVLLSATLRESKEHADRLSLACAQCSAEAGALRVALAAADRAVEAYDVLLALAETSHHHTDPTANRMRVATERVARQLLARLDAEGAGLLPPDTGPGPWADPAAMLLYHPGGISGGAGWNEEEEERLRGHVSRLKRERTVAASGAQPAPWPLQDENDGSNENLGSGGRLEKCLDPVDARRLDMETAVLMQEVMSLREERAELRARLRQLRPNQVRLNNSTNAEEGESERRLLEALARENTLKTRLQRLMASVHQAGRGNENIENLRRDCPRCSPQNRLAVVIGEKDSAPIIIQDSNQISAEIIHELAQQSIE